VLDKDIAIELAEVLTDIPNKSRMPGAMKAAVRKLQKWCVGSEIAGCHRTPEAQARWLVDKACNEWSTWNGYGALYALYLGRFPPPRENTQPEAVPAITRESARKHVQRLLACTNFPSDRQSIEGLAECLMESALSGEVAERVICACKGRGYCRNLDDLKTACGYAALHVDLTNFFDDIQHEFDPILGASVEEPN
jgi:hypothetical protein